MTNLQGELGQLEQAGDRWRLRYERRFPHPPEKVWRAITEPEHLGAWFPSDIEGERATGAKLRFVFRHDEGPTMDGEMLAFEPHSLLEMRWNDELLRFELEPDGSGTRLTFVNTFGELGKAARDAAGWHVCLHALQAELDGVAGAREELTKWTDVHPLYVEELGPAASTIGPPGS